MYTRKGEGLWEMYAARESDPPSHRVLKRAPRRAPTPTDTQGKRREGGKARRAPERERKREIMRGASVRLRAGEPVPAGALP